MSNGGDMIKIRSNYLNLIMLTKSTLGQIKSTRAIDQSHCSSFSLTLPPSLDLTAAFNGSRRRCLSRLKPPPPPDPPRLPSPIPATTITSLSDPDDRRLPFSVSAIAQHIEEKKSCRGEHERPGRGRREAGERKPNWGGNKTSGSCA
ncbi:hypothetical protein Droror1_Dr00009963 [Drosera rotundifolia]